MPAANRSKRARAYWTCQVVGWGAVVTLNITFALIYDGAAGIRRFGLMYATGAIAGILCSHLFRGFVRRRGWIELAPWPALPRLIGGSLVTGVAITALVTLSSLFVLPPMQVLRTFRLWFPSAMFIWTTTSFVWTVLYFGIHYFERYQRSEIARLQLAVVAKDAQLRALLWQINPHFMFNSLNSVRALISEDPQRAQDM